MIAVLAGDRADHTEGDLLLGGDQPARLGRVRRGIGPDLMPVHRVGEPGRHLDGLRVAPDCASEREARAHCPRQLHGVRWAIGRLPVDTAGNNRDILESAQLGDDLLGQPDGERQLIGVAGQVFERQHGDGQSLGLP